MSKQVTKKMQNSIHKYGTTICSNGWDNIAWCPSLNIRFACSNGNVFIGSIDIIGKQKNAHYKCNAVIGYIKTIGMKNIVKICTNSASSMRSVTNFWIYCFPTIYFQGCATHCLNLLLQDWEKTTWVNWIVKKAKTNVSFIRQHHVPPTIFHHYETNLMLLKPIETQFVTNFLMVEKLFKLKLAIEQTITNPNFTRFVNTLCGTHHQKSLTKVRVAWTNIKKNKCLDTCANFVHMVELVLMSLKAFNGKQPYMGRYGLLWKHCNNMSYHYEIHYLNYH